MSHYGKIVLFFNFTFEYEISYNSIYWVKMYPTLQRQQASWFYFNLGPICFSNIFAKTFIVEKLDNYIRGVNVHHIFTKIPLIYRRLLIYIMCSKLLRLLQSQEIIVETELFLQHQLSWLIDKQILPERHQCSSDIVIFDEFSTNCSFSQMKKELLQA